MKIIVNIDKEHRRELESLSPTGNVYEGLARAISIGITYHEMKQEEENKNKEKTS